MTEPATPSGDAARHPSAPNNPPRPDLPAEAFRWQALFQRSSDPIFVLDSQRRLRFVNRAWEALTGLSAADVRLLSCRRRQPAAAGDGLLEVLAHALCPPPEVLKGELGRARRRLPGGDRHGRRVWDVEFFPVRNGDGVSAITGRVIPRTEELPPTGAPLPEKLIDLRARATRRYDFVMLDSVVPAVRRLAEQVRLATELSVPVLLTGEAGTGKETLARVIHYRGPRGELPLATVDCARLPAEAVAQVLFADHAGAGRPGAIYVREPGYLPRDLQMRLCELMASGAGPRVLAGCRAAPDEEIQSGRLLDELLAAFPLVLELPSLRRRAADVPALIDKLLQRANEAGGNAVHGLTPAARELLLAQTWPGNVRELFAALSAARRHATGSLIDVADLPAGMRQRHAAGPPPAPERPLPLDALLEQTERRLIELALRRAKGHRGRAAEILGIWRARLLRRLEALGLGEPTGKDKDEG
jgi:transcriptional regulator with PAS, ATPase and Fis domain